MERKVITVEITFGKCRAKIIFMIVFFWVDQYWIKQELIFNCFSGTPFTNPSTVSCDVCFWKPKPFFLNVCNEKSIITFKFITSISF